MLLLPWRAKEKKGEEFRFGHLLEVPVVRSFSPFGAA
jgi:hypothetical protein